MTSNFTGRERRPLSEHSRLILARALHNRSLIGLTGQDRKRTAARIGELRTSDDAAALLIDWWGGKPFGPLNFGTNLVEHALAGNSAYVTEALMPAARVPPQASRPGGRRFLRAR